MRRVWSCPAPLPGAAEQAAPRPPCALDVPGRHGLQATTARWNFAPKDEPHGSAVLRALRAGQPGFPGQTRASANE